jgi:ubiquinone/menaquinone biosynthesis C-methylase UbiE
MPNEIMSKVLSEIVRVTKHSGRIIIFDYNNDSRGVSKFFLDKIVKIPESKYYSAFINSPMSKIIQNRSLKLVKSKEYFKGFFKLWIYQLVE